MPRLSELSEVDYYVYRLSLLHPDSTAGSEAEGVEYRLIRFTFDEALSLSDRSVIAAIVTNDADGFIQVDYFHNEEQMASAWALRSS